MRTGASPSFTTASVFSLTVRDMFAIEGQLVATTELKVPQRGRGILVSCGGVLVERWDRERSCLPSREIATVT